MDKYKLNEDVDTAFHILLSIVDDRAKHADPEQYQKVIEIRNTLMLERLIFEMCGDYSKMKITKSFLQTIVEKCNKAIQIISQTKDENTEDVSTKDDNTKPTEEDDNENK